MITHTLEKGGVARRLIENLYAIQGTPQIYLLRQKSGALVDKILAIHRDLSEQTEKMVNARYDISAVLQELDEKMEEIYLEHPPGVLLFLKNEEEYL